MLQYILSPKVILVEGPTEYLLLPKIFEKLYNTTFEKERITIIECGGIKYKRYFNIIDEYNNSQFLKELALYIASRDK